MAIDKKDTVSKASKGYIEKYYNNAKTMKGTIGFGSLPEFDRDKALDTVRKDNTVLAALNTLVDKSMTYGYTFVDKSKKENSKLQEVFDGLRGRRLLRQAFYNLYAYGNVFIEIVKNGRKEVKELNILETTLTEPISDAHGTILGYEQVVVGGDPKDGDPTWKPEEVVHIALTKLTTGIWGEIDIGSIYTSVLIKQYIYAYLGWLFGTNQMKGFFNIKESNDDSVKEFMSLLKKSNDNLQLPLVARGDITHVILRDFKDGDSIMNLLNKCDSNILTLLQVPPISVSLPGDSNRSNSDAQERSLNTRISSGQDVITEGFKFDLIPKMGFEGNSILFDPIEKANIEKLLENAERMKNIGFKKNILEEYLKLEGFPISGDLIDEDTYENAGETSDDMFASRQGKDEGAANKKIGSGKDSTTREDQIVKKGKTSYHNIDPEKQFLED